MTSLRQKLIEYIRLHKQVHFRDIENYAEDNGYKAYTAVRRLQEVRDPKDAKHYDRTIGAIMEGVTIKFYIYKPAFMVMETPPAQASQPKPPKVEPSTVQPAEPRKIANTAPPHKPPWQQQPAFHRPVHRCCTIAILCYEKGLKVTHSQRCLNEQAPPASTL
jgi:hypothetical protein